MFWLRNKKIKFLVRTLIHIYNVYISKLFMSSSGNCTHQTSALHLADIMGVRTHYATLNTLAPGKILGDTELGG